MLGVTFEDYSYCCQHAANLFYYFLKRINCESSASIFLSQFRELRRTWLYWAIVQFHFEDKSNSYASVMKQALYVRWQRFDTSGIIEHIIFHFKNLRFESFKDKKVHILYVVFKDYFLLLATCGKSFLLLIPKNKSGCIRWFNSPPSSPN